MSHRGITIKVMRYEIDDDGKLYYAYMVHHYTTVYHALMMMIMNMRLW